MPKRTDIKKILIIGAGPIVIGQACEFDYSGTQGVKALKEEGFEIILINSNPATIMTDPELADRTYIEPLTPEVVAQIIEREMPDAILPTLGGQTALNITMALNRMGVLKKFGVELIGANVEAIEKAEDRDLFRKAMAKIGLDTPDSRVVTSEDEGMRVVREIGFPAILRPAFTMGGSGGGIAYSLKEYQLMIARALDASPVRQVLVEQSVLGWKEYELEVVRDKNDNVIIICSIENLDPMGIHTGDSITVAPAQTLTDKEYQNLRDAAVRIIREIGVETGGSNIQFAVNPKNGHVIVIEMNPRVSRSSALASKATGFPIAKIAAKLAVGYTLDELKNDITAVTPASFEPVIDYVVTKIPRFAFEKFKGADDRLTTQMKSVGEVMAIGRTFSESLQKALRSLENGSCGFDEKNLVAKTKAGKTKELLSHLTTARADRLWWVGQAFREGLTVSELNRHTRIDPWFLCQIENIILFEIDFKKQTRGGKSILPALLLKAKRMGFSDKRLAQLAGVAEDRIRALRQRHSVRPVFKKVDTCAAEFEAITPYLYSAYEQEDESLPSRKKKVVILGGGPNRIGQGIEFDYCCCHASFALQKEGYEVLMVNCNPETVSTDYDTSDKLYFEPLTLEDVTRILEIEKPVGVIVQFGGQTPLKLSMPLEKWGAKILGTSSDSIDRMEDRRRFATFINKLGLKQPVNGLATSVKEAMAVAARIGYPLLARPSYVLGGRAMEIIYSEKRLHEYLTTAVEASEDKPVLIDRFLENAIEVDVDALCDGRDVFIGGVMEHIERAGIHSGDSACCIPPHSLSPSTIKEIIRQTRLMAMELKVVGLMNVQFAVKEGQVYVLEVNPRASRTVPFVSKATGIPLAKYAARVMLGQKIKSFGIRENLTPAFYSVKEAVFPFTKFPGVDTLLGPEMRSTGEVMGIDKNFALAFAKSQMAAGNTIPLKGKVFVSVRDADKPAMVFVSRMLQDNGFKIVATQGTASFLSGYGVLCEVVKKHYEGEPNILRPMNDGEISMLINTHEGGLSEADSFVIRSLSIKRGIPYFTTIAAAMAVAVSVQEMNRHELTVRCLQEIDGFGLRVTSISRKQG